jgi:putative hydrolase of the HAD superfamily
MIQFLLFDLDETLYPRSAGMFREVGRRIHHYLEQMGIPKEEVRQVRQQYYQRYGTTLRGLQLHHQVDTDDYLDYVHSFDVATYIRPNSTLDEVLSELPYEKIIFTNATTEYAWRVLTLLGVDHHFEQIFDIRAIRFYCKPHPIAFRIVLEELATTGPQCLLIDDNLRNLQTAKEMGMRTVLVDGPTKPHEFVDFHIADIGRIGDVVKTFS